MLLCRIFPGKYSFAYALGREDRGEPGFHPSDSADAEPHPRKGRHSGCEDPAAQDDMGQKRGGSKLPPCIYYFFSGSLLFRRRRWPLVGRGSGSAFSARRA